MNTFPLIRIKQSNEHVMAGVFLVLVLYHIPIWLDQPGRIADFLLITAASLLLDAIISIIRYKRMWCCVSAAVTAAIISLLTQGIPVWGQLIGVAAALILGKHLWGGTGKNWFNPAVIGLLVILVFWKIPYPFFDHSYLLLPAIILSLLFLTVRPYAGIGFIIGAAAALLVNGDFSFINLLTYGVFFWSGIVLTDPVTITNKPVIASISGLAAGFSTLYFNKGPVMFVIIILAINIISYGAERILEGKSQTVKPKLKLPKVFPYEKEQFVDLTGEVRATEEAELGVTELSPEEILRSIKYNGIYGMGGAAFPTDKKLMTVLASKAKQKYLIVNGVECDPGLIHDNYILSHNPEEIYKGIEILKECVHFDSVYLAVKDAGNLKFPKELRIHVVPDQYPSGAEKILIREVLGIQLEKNIIPASSGILVLNVQTVYAIFRAIYLNKPADTKFLTTANLNDKSAKVVNVRIGMKLRDIMEAVYPGTSSIFTGGGIMQACFAEEESCVERSTNFIATGTMPKYKESPQCSHCGKCISNCPAGLMVNRIADLVEQGKLKDALRYKPIECIQCASCSYSCMAGRNLAAKVRVAMEAAK